MANLTEMKSSGAPVGSAPNHDESHPHKVKITINKKEYEVPEGRLEVAEIKRLAKVPPADEVEQVIDRKFIPLPDNGHVEVKGGEIFITHPRDSGSS